MLMQLPQLRDFSPAAKYAVGVYVFLIGCILAVAMFLSYQHMGGFGSKSSVKDKDAVSIEESGAEADDEDEESAVEIIGEEESSSSEKPNLIETPWYQYDNVKLGHVHVNGQSLVFFTVVLLFILTSASSTNKKIWITILAFSIIMHTFGLFWQHKAVFKVVLRVGGGLFGLATTIMCFYILKDILSKESA